MFNVLQLVLDAFSVTRPANQYVKQTGSRTEHSEHLNPPTSIHRLATNSEPRFRSGIYDGCPKLCAKLTIFQSKSIGKFCSCLWLVWNILHGAAAPRKKCFLAHAQCLSKWRGMVTCVLNKGLLLNFLWHRRAVVVLSVLAQKGLIVIPSQK
jgi:hypothetical protein